MKRFQLALVTGASSGLGTSICYLLAEQGISLMISARNVQKLEDLQKLLIAKVPVTIHPADLSNNTARQELICVIKERKPDLILNNAGFGLYGDALSHSIKEQMEILEVNANAALEISLEAAQMLIKDKKHGTIVNISSAAAFFPYPTFSVYAASKTFLKEFSQAFDEEVKPFGVRVLTACPGQINTNFRYRASGSVPQKGKTFSMSSEKAATFILKQIQQEKSLYIFDWPYRLGIVLARILMPKKILFWSLKKAIAKRHHFKNKRISPF
jgi:uncharacterized protein